MVTSTRKSSKMPRPHKPSAKARTNSSKISKSEPKQHVLKKFINPETIDKEPTSVPSEPSASPIETPVNVFDVKYTLAIYCMLGTTPIFTDTKKFKLGQFQLQDFTDTIIKKLAKAVNNTKYTAEWESATVVISADRFSKAQWISVDVEEESRWKVIEEWIEELMIKKCVNVTAKLTVIYRKLERDDVESQDEDKEPKRGAKVQNRTLNEVSKNRAQQTRCSRI